MKNQQTPEKLLSSNSWLCRCAGALAAVILVSLLSFQAQAQYWNGLGADNNWSNTNNWTATTGGVTPTAAPGSGSFSHFEGNVQTSVNKDTPSSVVLSAIYFQASPSITAGNWILSGNQIAITGVLENDINQSFYGTQPATINCDLNINGATGGFLVRPNGGDLVINGSISSTDGSFIQKGNNNNATFNGASTFNGRIFILGGGTLNFSSVKNLGGAPNSLGQPTLANSIIQLGVDGNLPTLNYIGSGDTSDRLININTTALASFGTLKNSGTGLLKFTGGIVARTGATAQRRIVLDGSTTGIGEIAGTITNATANGIQILKNGTGTWRLSGNNETKSGTTISAGKLVGVTGGSSSNSPCTVSAGATNGVLVLSAGGKWIQSTYTFTAGTFCEFDFGASVLPSTSVAPMQAIGNVSLTNPIIIIKAGNLPAGTYPLIKAGGTLSGTPSGTILLPPRVAATLSTTAGAGGGVNLVVTAGSSGVTWTNGTGTWDIATSTNWKDSGSVGTTYQELNGIGDAVLFNDSALGAAPFAVTLDTVVTPAGVTVNSTNEYLISGTGGIAGAGNLTKQGTNTLTLNTANTYTGNTIISAGTLALGGSGSISNTANISIAAGATLDVSAIANYALPLGCGLNATGNGTSATIKGGTTVSFGSRQVALSFAPTAFSGDATHPALTISSGALVLGGNGFSINNAGGTPLGAGSYNLINVTSGNVTGTPTTAAINVTGAGLAANMVANLSVSGGNVVLTVAIPTTTTLTTPLVTKTYGDNVTFTATVAATPTPAVGVVQFYDNGNALGGPVSVSSGTASYSTTNLSAGTHPITAAYTGASGYASSATASATNQVINKAPLTITMYPQSKEYGNLLYLFSDGTGFEQHYDGTNWVTIYTTNSWFATGLVNGERLTNAYVNMSGPVGGAASQPVGIYPGSNPPPGSGIFTDASTATFKGDNGFLNSNYEFTRVPATYTVYAAPLTITAIPESKAYGDSLALGTTAFTVSGLVDGNTVTAVSLSATNTPPGTDAGDAPGAYPITPSAATGANGFDAANYAINYVNGTLSVLAPFSATSSTSGQVGWASQAGASYTVQYKDDLTQASWINLTNVTAVGTSTTITDPSPSATQRFYRIISP